MEDIQTTYPCLPDILDEVTLAGLATLESREKAFSRRRGRNRHQYLRALYLKAFRALGYGHIQPSDLPRQLRIRIAEQLGGGEDLVDLRKIDRRERSRILRDVRAFLEVRRASSASKKEIEKWLTEGLASREGNLAVLTNAAIERFRQTDTEIPPLPDVSALAQRALDTANAALVSMISKALTDTQGAKLLSLVDGTTAGKLALFKKPTGAASTNNIHAELRRLEDLDAFQPDTSMLSQISRRKMEELATLVKRYDTSELRQLRASRRRAALACFAAVRRSELLDDLADMFIRVWDSTDASAKDHADQRHKSLVQAHERHGLVLRDLIKAIRTSQDAAELWQAIHAYSEEYYEDLWAQLEEVTTWADGYHGKLEDYYTALRRFLPQWYELMPVTPTTSDDSLVRAMHFLRHHAKSNDTELPVQSVPTRFLTSTWASRAVRRYPKTGQVIRVYKAPYELGWCEATAGALKSGSLAVQGAQRYAAMTDHLLDRDAFLRDYTDHSEKLGLPQTAETHYEPLRQQLAEKIEEFDSQYEDKKHQFWMHPDGTLGFSAVPGKGIPSRAKKLNAALANYMPNVSILDVLLDSHRWTGYMDSFRPLSGRQNMRESEKIRQVLAALYAYGCNCGPTQAARGVGLSKNQVVYIRRHYMGTKQLIDAASTLAEAYGRTKTASLLGSPGVLLTDAMHVRTLKRGLRARPHHRDWSHKNILLYQHITSHCVCQFTQALLCNVSEAIHMLHGVLESRKGQDPLICITDSAGKSDLAFGLASLLNIGLGPRNGLGS